MTQILVHNNNFTPSKLVAEFFIDGEHVNISVHDPFFAGDLPSRGTKRKFTQAPDRSSSARRRLEFVEYVCNDCRTYLLKHNYSIDISNSNISRISYSALAILKNMR